MRIGIIHLSDLHISSKAAIHQEKISALINSLQLLQPFEGVIIAFSGDIAGKGKSNEYLLASRLIGSLASELQSKYNVSPTNTKIILAPGNHDMNREISPQVEREKVEEWYKKKEIVDHISDELNRMKDFYDFADQQKCFFASDIFPFTRKVLPFISSEGEKFFVEVNIFNSALFSSSEDNGIHFMPPSVFSYYDMWSPAQLSLSIMHHSPDWFWPEQKVKLQERLYNRSNLLLNLYYTVARNSATPATISNLTRPDYATNTNSLLERMMLFEEVDDWYSFKNEAEKLFAKSDSSMVRNMILAMVYHILVWSPSLPVDQRHHLMDWFKFKKDSKNILIQNMRLK